MRVIVFDTETTGLRPGHICQLAYLVAEDPGAGGVVDAKNMYFAVPHVPEGAAKIHGLTADALKSLSGGKGFKDRAGEIEDAFGGCDLWIAHNVDFDRSFLLAEFARAGRAPREARNYCTMRELTAECKLPSSRPGMPYKFPTLAQAAKHLKIADESIRRCCVDVFGDCTSNGFHDARYDAAAAYLCFLAALRLGLAP